MKITTDVKADDTNKYYTLSQIRCEDGVYDYLNRQGELSPYCVVVVSGVAYFMNSNTFEKVHEPIWSDIKFLKSKKTVTVTFSN